MQAEIPPQVRDPSTHALRLLIAFFKTLGCDCWNFCLVTAAFEVKSWNSNTSAFSILGGRQINQL